MRRTDIDNLKGFAIIAVILFHMYILKSGYLGVDLFFVISGYLIIPRLVEQFSQEKLIFNYFQYEKKRIMRLWPLIVIAGLVCLIVGYVGMLPDDYENLTENIIASDLLSTNILSSVTIKDYWAVRTSYQPLMHLWYVGILVEYYLILPLVLYGTRLCAIRCSWNVKRSLVSVLAILSLASLVLYLLPSENASVRFYLLPYRFFELTIGGVFCVSRIKSKILSCPKSVYVASLICLTFVICISLASMEWEHIGLEEVPVGAKEAMASSNVFLLPRQACLILTVFLSVIALVLGEKYGMSLNVLNIGLLAHLGVMSFSLFIWHQIMLAFYRYYVTADINLPFVILFFVLLYVISYMSFRFVENRFNTARSQAFIGLLAIVVCALSFGIYNNAGVVRDIPELGYKKANVKRGMHKQYTDRIYKLSCPFEDNGKMNILLKGNSFARDFGSILMESKYKDTINIFLIKDYAGISENMVRKADYAFIFSDKDDVPDIIWHNLDPKKVYGIGTKTFGDSNGVIYKNRNSSTYFDQVITPRKEYVALNRQWAESWGDHYINLMEMSMDGNGQVKIFTPDSMFMSQDCRHLTQAGAKYMASLINFDKIFAK